MDQPAAETVIDIDAPTERESAEPDDNDFESPPSNEQENRTDLPVEKDAPPPDAPIETAPKKGLFARLKRGLAKTRDILTTDIEDLFSGKLTIDDDMLEELEELLITSDIGVQTAMELIQTIQKRAAKIDGPEGLKSFLKQEIQRLLEDVTVSKEAEASVKPHVIMVVGVNGVGKTTTIGKLSHRAASRGDSVLIAAADTFRAAATDQLAIWAERSGADIVKHKDNTDPAAVAYDGIEAASRSRYRYSICGHRRTPAHQG